MQVFKLALADSDLLLKNIKLSRQDNAKKIRETYKSLVDSRASAFQKAENRILQNLRRFTEDSLHSKVLTLDFQTKASTYKDQLTKIDAEIEKVQAIIQHGCGTVKIREKTEVPLARTYTEGSLHSTSKTEHQSYPQLSKFNASRMVQVSKQQLLHRKRVKEDAATKIQRWWRQLTRARQFKRTVTINKRFAKRQYY